MPEDEKPMPEGIEVEKTVMKKGKLGFYPKYPTSSRLRLVLETVVYSNTGLVSLVSGSDVFTGGQAKKISFILSAIGIIAGVFIKITGVKPYGKKKEDE